MSEQLVSRPGHSGGNPQTQDPTTTLKHALAAFKSVLTEEQQQEFLASNDKPDITSVISFVAEIDANNSSTARRCVAPRLYTFLESTQQFTAIVDTFVSSNPQIAALVWGGVKFAILSASNVSSYFEKFTSMIMQIGKTCPKYQQFGQLYPGCVGLQRELCKYYATIVHLCIKVVEICQRPTVLQIFSSVFNPFESEFQPFLSQLEHTITSVRLEISLAANQAIQEMRNLVEYESRNSTSFRRLALKFNERSQKAEAEAKEWRLNKLERENSELRSTIKDNLSNFDFATPWKLALSQRVPFTAEWLQQEAMFSEWRYLPQSSILWCPGKMGVGKTVMMSNVVTHLHSSRKPDDVISYSFCSAEYLVSLSARNVFGVFARQLLESQIEIADNKKLQELESLTRNIDTAQIIDLLLSYLEPSKQYFLVLDGVDEFESDELNDLKSGLANLCSSQNQAFKLICTGQFELESKLFDSKTPKLTIPINGSKVDLDIDQYIRTIIHEEKKLKLRDHGLITKIFDALHEGSNGMFLWAHFTIQDLCACNSDKDILDSLKSLPQSLLEIFNKRISRIRAQKRSGNAIKSLKYCGVLKRPLTVMGYQELLSLSPDQKSLDRGSFPNDMDRVWSDCCGLVFVDEEENTVHYVHQSIKQYLFHTKIPSLVDFDAETIDDQLGFLCMTYLDFSDFKRQLAKVPKYSNTPLQPIDFAISSISWSRDLKKQIALKLLSHHRQLQITSPQELERNMEKILPGLMSSPQTTQQENEFYFLEYAQAHWILHTSHFNMSTNQDMYDLFCRCMRNEDVLAHKPWETIQDDEQAGNQARFVAEAIITQSHRPLLSYHVTAVPRILDLKRYVLILQDCKIQDRFFFTKLIVDQAYDEWSAFPNYGFYYAAKAGCLESVIHCIESNRVRTKFVMEGRTPLQEAVEGGHLTVVSKLLEIGSAVDFPFPKILFPRLDGPTALQLAARHGHLEIVERLLLAGADPNSIPSEWAGASTALYEAAKNGHLKVVKRLLVAEANAHAGANAVSAETALEIAVKGGYLDIAEWLLEAGADLDHDHETIARAAESFLRAAQSIVETAEVLTSGHLHLAERLLVTAQGVCKEP